MTISVAFEEGYPYRSFVEDILKRYAEGERNFELESSGSTGVVKKVMLSERILKWSCNQTKFSLHLEDEKVLCCLPVNRTGGFMQIMRALCFDWEIHFIKPEINPLDSIPEDHPYTLTSLSPLQLYQSLKNSPEKVKRFQTILVGGAKVSDELRRMVRDFSEQNHDIDIVETYGMTETASHIALKYLNKDEQHFSPQMGVIVSTDEQQRLVVSIPELKHEVHRRYWSAIFFWLQCYWQSRPNDQHGWVKDPSKHN